MLMIPTRISLNSAGRNDTGERMNQKITTKDGKPITLAMMREVLYSAVVCDALDSLGYTRQSPSVQLPPQPGINKRVGRCKTTLWADMAQKDPKPYELELIAVDGCKPDDV